MRILFFTIIFMSCIKPGQETLKYSETYRYFLNAELQFENDQQKYVIRQALKDMLFLDADDLEKKKYPDYSGNLDQWTILELIGKYFVPDDKKKDLSGSFYQDLKDDDVKDILLDFLCKTK